MEKEYINGKEYRYVVVRGRGKYVSRDGDAFNPKRRNQKATITINRDGYPCFGGSIPIHLYVAHAWVDGYYEGAEVNHKDFNRMNYNADNLEWMSHKENTQYTIDNNYDVFCKSKQGQNNGRAKFTPNQVLKIREMYDNGSSIADIIRYFYPELKSVKQYKNIHSNVSSIARRKTWKNL